MESQAGSEPPRKRQRRAKSCQQCRNRKVRCDQAQPCGPCRRSRDRLVCTYRDIDEAGQREDDSPTDLPPSDVAFTGPERPFGREMARFELAHGDPGGADQTERSWTVQNTTRVGNTASNGLSQSHNHIDGPGASHDRTQSLYPDATIERLENRIRHLEEEAAHSRSSRVSGGDGHRGDNDRSRNIPEINPATPRLRMTTEKAKLFSQSHWVHTAEKVFSFGSFNSEVEPIMGTDRAEWAKVCTDLMNIRHSVKRQQQPVDVKNPLQISDIYSTLPSPELCGILFDNYMRTFERIHRIVDIPRFSEQYDQFWDDPSQFSNKPFVMKLVSILAIGVAFLSVGQAGVDTDEIEQLRCQAQQWIFVAQWWLAGPTANKAQNLNSLQIFCLVLIARQVNGLGHSPSLSPGSLLSMALQMGLHRNSGIFPTLSRLQAECMARLWATTTEISLASYLESGAPILEAYEDFDALKPSNIDDSELKETPGSAVPSTSDNRTTDTSIQLLLLKSQKLRVQALKIINGARLSTSYETVVDLANQLRMACTEVTIFFQDRSAALGHKTSFHKKYIDMYLRKHILLLHRPFMLEAQKNPRYYLSRKMCLESCMIMASYTDELHLPSIVADDFLNLMARGSGFLRGGLSLNVIMTLAFELNIQLQEDGPTNNVEPTSYDPARELARAAREPIIRRLEHIRNQLFQIIDLGNPSLKRFLMISSFLGQFKALETGGNAKVAFYNAFTDSAQKCMGSLQAYLEKHTPRMAAASSVTSSFPDDFDFDFSAVDLENFMDPLILFEPCGLKGTAAANIRF